MLGVMDTGRGPALSTKTSPSSYVLVDCSKLIQQWSVLLAEYADSWRISVGPVTPLYCVRPARELGDEDIELLLSKADLLLTDRDTYVEMAKKAGVEVIKVG